MALSTFVFQNHATDRPAPALIPHTGPTPLHAFRFFILTHSGSHTLTLARTHTHTHTRARANTRTRKLFYTDTGTQRFIFKIHSHAHTPTDTRFILFYLVLCSSSKLYSFLLSLFNKLSFKLYSTVSTIISFPTPPLLPNPGWLKRLATREKVGMIHHTQTNLTCQSFFL